MRCMISISVGMLLLVSGRVWAKGGGVDVVYSPEGSLLAVTDKTDIRLYQLPLLNEVGVLQGHSTVVSSLAFSPDGIWLVSGSDDRTIRLWDVEQRQSMASIEGHKFGILSVAFSPDGKRFVSGGMDGTVRVWDRADQEEIWRWAKGGNWLIYSVAFSPDNRRVAATISDATTRVWDIAIQQQVAVFRTSSRAVRFSPDGKWIALGDDKLHLWDATTYEEKAVLQESRGGILSLAFNPDGSRIATATREGNVQVWNIEQRKLMTVFEGHTASIGAVSFSPDGKSLATVDYDGSLSIWDLEDIPTSVTGIPWGGIKGSLKR